MAVVAMVTKVQRMLNSLQTLQIFAVVFPVTSTSSGTILQSFMRFDERNPKNFKSTFCFHGNCGKVCPTDSDYFGLSRSIRCGCCSYQASSISESVGHTLPQLPWKQKVDLKFLGFLSSNLMKLCRIIHRSVWQLLGLKTFKMAVVAMVTKVQKMLKSSGQKCVKE
jgi:hypothetical protein